MLKTIYEHLITVPDRLQGASAQEGWQQGQLENLQVRFDEMSDRL